jgi:hypothetical protein
VVVLVKDGNRWAAADPRSWGSEADLEEVLAENPDLIPGCEGSAVVSQFSIAGVGIVDLICVDELGSITLVECKLAKNAEIRRAVIGQIFAYASGLSGTSEAEFSAVFAKRGGHTLLDAVSAAAVKDVEPEEFARGLRTNLAEGRFRLVVAVDAITPELRAIIEYLNLHLAATASIMAFELGRVLVGDTAVLVPATYGAEAADRKAAKPGVRRRWSPAEIASAAAEVYDPAERRFLENVLSYADESGANVRGGGGSAPSAGFYYIIDGTSVSAWSLYVRQQGSVVALNLGSVRRASEDRVRQMLAVLRRSTALDSKLPADDEAALHRYTEVPVSTIVGDPDALKCFWQAIEVATRHPGGQYSP